MRRYDLVPSRHLQRDRDRLGLTLIEVVVSMMLVSAVLLVCLNTSANLMRGHGREVSTLQSEAVIGPLLDEIAALPFRDLSDQPSFGLEAGESAGARGTFDDVDDYVQYTASPPRHRDGAAIDGAEGWSVGVTVQPAETSGSGFVIVDDEFAPLRAVTVTADSPDGQSFSQTVLVADVPRTAGISGSIQQWRELRVQWADGRRMSVTAPLVNQPEHWGSL